MTLERVPGTELNYFLVSFDSEGNERPEGQGGLLSERILNELADRSVTDVFFLSHGWKGDIPAAKEQYNAWIGAAAQCEADIQAMKGRPQGFSPLILGLHWPSLPWGEETISSAPASFDLTFEPDDSADTLVEKMVGLYAERISGTARAIKALHTIFETAANNLFPEQLPSPVVDAYLALNEEAGLGAQDDGQAPGRDRNPFDPKLTYQNAKQAAAASFGNFDLGGILSPLRQLSFWKMKDRARRFGESGAHQLLSLIQSATAGKQVRLHLMGHSFGCIVVSAAVAGPPSDHALTRPVDSVFLVQGALSLWSYCSSIEPHAPGTPGYFHSIMANRWVAGPIVTTQSHFDTAVGRFYPLGAGVAGQYAFDPIQLPKYGALGSFGFRGPGFAVSDGEMLAADQPYGFKAGVVHNLESSRVICNGGGASGAHSDIAKPEVGHAMWQAALTAP